MINHLKVFSGVTAVLAVLFAIGWSLGGALKAVGARKQPVEMPQETTLKAVVSEDIAKIGWGEGIREVQWKGHEYLWVNTPKATSFIHAQSCPCVSNTPVRIEK